MKYVVEKKKEKEEEDNILEGNCGKGKQ